MKLNPKLSQGQHHTVPHIFVIYCGTFSHRLATSVTTMWVCDMYHKHDRLIGLHIILNLRSEVHGTQNYTILRIATAPKQQIVFFEYK